MDLLFLEGTTTSTTTASTLTTIPVDLQYHNYQEMTSKLNSLVSEHSDLLTLYKLSGKSVEGRKLWVVRISTEKDQRADLKPMVKYTANMHGNEAVGRELMLAFIEYLAESYKNGSDPVVTQLISN